MSLEPTALSQGPERLVVLRDVVVLQRCRDAEEHDTDDENRRWRAAADGLPDPSGDDEERHDREQGKGSQPRLKAKRPGQNSPRRRAI